MIDYNIDLELLLTKGLSWPDYSINLQLQSETLIDSTKKISSWHGSAKSMIELVYHTKDQSETVVENNVVVRDQNIEILNLRIDGIKIPSKMIIKLGSYEPKYRQDFLDYCKNNSIHVGTEPQHTLHFYHSGRWSLQLPEKFWLYYNQLQTTSIDNDYVGNSPESIKTNLSRLKKILYELQ